MGEHGQDSCSDVSHKGKTEIEMHLKQKRGHPRPVGWKGGVDEQG